MFKTQVEPRATGRRVVSLQSFERLISMVYKSVDHGKLWSICFLQLHVFSVSCEVSRKMLHHFHGLWSHGP